MQPPAQEAISGVVDYTGQGPGKCAFTMGSQNTSTLTARVFLSDGEISSSPVKFIMLPSSPDLARSYAVDLAGRLLTTCSSPLLCGFEVRLKEL